MIAENLPAFKPIRNLDFSMSILVIIQDSDPNSWSKPVSQNLPTHNVYTWYSDGPLSSAEKENIKYVMAWKPPFGIYKQFPNLEVIFSLGAGVDHVLSDPDLPNIPIVRYVSPDLTIRIGEWVILQVLFHMRHQSAYLSQQINKNWNELPQPSASEINVGGIRIRSTWKTYSTSSFRNRL